AGRPKEARAGEEANVIRRTFEKIGRVTGKPVKGWLSSGLQQTWDTLDLLAAQGCLYQCDWCNDDQPYVMHLDGGKQILSVHYPQQCNDKPAYEHMLVTPDEFTGMLCRTFDVLSREGETSGR